MPWGLASSVVGGLVILVKPSLLDELLQKFLPDLRRIFSSNSIPSGYEDGVSYNRIDLNGGFVGSAHVSLLNGARAQLDVNEIQTDVSNTNFRVSKYGINCAGHFWGHVRSTNATAIARFSTRPIISEVLTNIRWGYFDVSHHLDDPFCRAVEVIVEAIIGDINKLIVSKLKKHMPSIIDKAFRELVNKLASRIGTELSLPHDVLFDYGIVNISSTSAEGRVEVVGQFRDALSPKPSRFEPHRISDNFEVHTANVRFSEFPINSASEVYTEKGLLRFQQAIPKEILSPTLIIQCGSQCEAKIDFWVSTPPYAIFRGAPNYSTIIYDTDSFVNISFVNETATGPICLVNLRAELHATFYIEPVQEVIQVKMNVAHIDFTIDKSWVGFLDTIVLDGALMFVANDFCQLFNHLFPGIPLPTTIAENIKMEVVKEQELHTIDLGFEFNISSIDAEEMPKNIVA